MVYRFVFTKTALKDVKNLDETVKKQIYRKLKHYVSQEDILAVAKKLTNSELGTYRLRIGNYRLVFDLDGKVVVVLRLQHRKDVYR